ncbi:hypothetical protein RQP54_02005 [Curvibacter sp. APW13]|uniref:hypothetical protein n=1 Tax=Curvibacter sp. APW13 TaxID=3077236 RepID=UPI0028DF8074|nr:hypothetical protein [Curvibacter sp. APW13]MDT8989631.1 hypothetical protein [Curvibacter sp. APW13]
MTHLDCSARGTFRGLWLFVSATALAVPVAVSAQTASPDWSLGVYAGKYHDAEPAGALTGKANYVEHYMVALTGSKTLWKHPQWPVSLELDGMLGQQSGKATLTEVAIAPALRFTAFQWKDAIRTDLRLAPLGLSYTSEVGPMEYGPDGRGSRTLNYLFVEAAFSRPTSASNEFFVRLHHRCAIYDLLNNYGANGEDFLTLGWRHRF